MGSRPLRRRDFLAFSAAGAAGAMATGPAALAATATPTATNDDAYWAALSQQYDRPQGVVQLEHGNWGAMARPVLDRYIEHLHRVNRDTSYYARRTMGPELQQVQATLASFLGVGTDEVILTRNATEALRALITRYRKLQPGDAVLYADHDYDSMQDSMVALRHLRGVEPIRIALPHPASYDSLIAAYRTALDANPRIRLILLTHIGHRSGLGIPVKEIAALARERGADVVVDAAHSLGQLDYTLPDLGADFIGVNLHKWIGAPLGVGAMIVKRERLGDIEPDPAANPESETGIRGLMHVGTFDFAAALTLPTAIAFQQEIGASRRAARLRAMRNRWTQPLARHPRIDILTPDDPRLHGAITSFRLRDTPDMAAHSDLARRLLDRHGIFTVTRAGLNAGACIRVTPALANSMGDLDRLVTALQAET